MNRLYWYLRGYCCVDIAGTSLDLVLNRLTLKRIAFWSPIWSDAFHLKICIFYKDLERVREQAGSSLCEVTLCGIEGIREDILHIFRRPIFWIGTILGLLIVLLGQNYLLFYEVIGNETVPSEAVIQVLDMLGIGVGTYGPDIEPKWIKDHVLNMLPELQWITVTQNGCRAQVVVRERNKAPQTERKGFANIISSRDALITEQSVLQGQAMKQAGDTVLEGELLVSGIMDLEKIFSIVYAKAEIYGRTWHENTVVTPRYALLKGAAGAVQRCVWLEVGNKRIKLFGNSSISYASCDKMVQRKVLSLPGGLDLPVCLVTEVFRAYETEKVEILQSEASEITESYALEAVQRDLTAGEILNERFSITLQNNVYRLESVMECREMIAKTIEGKWNKEDFLDD